MWFAAGLDLPGYSIARSGRGRAREAKYEIIPAKGLSRYSVPQPSLSVIPERDVQIIQARQNLPEMPERLLRAPGWRLPESAPLMQYSRPQEHVIQPRIVEIAPSPRLRSPSRSRSRSRSRCQERVLKVGPLEYKRRTCLGIADAPRHRRVHSDSSAYESPRVTRYIREAQPDPMYEMIVESRRHDSPRRSRSVTLRPAVHNHRRVHSLTRSPSSSSSSSKSSTISSSSSVVSAIESISSKASTVSSASSNSSATSSKESGSDESTTITRGRSRRPTSIPYSTLRAPSPSLSYIRTRSTSPSPRPRSSSRPYSQPPALRSILKKPHRSSAFRSSSEDSAEWSTRARGGDSYGRSTSRASAERRALRANQILRFAKFAAGDKSSRQSSRESSRRTRYGFDGSSTMSSY